jgi:putative membrane protein
MTHRYTTHVTASLLGLGLMLVSGSRGRAQTPQTPANVRKTFAPSSGAFFPQGTARGLRERAARIADRTFVMQAAMGGLKEVAAGRLASDRATNEDVKKFAQQMVADHE